MKTLKNFIQINEARKSKYDAPSTIYFPNMSAYLIYEYELSGQISDGYWENSRPESHWRWVSNATPEISKDKIGYTGPKHRLTYNTEWLRKEVKKALKGAAGDYDWTIRVFKYAKFGSILNDSDMQKFSRNDGDDIRVIMDKLPDEKVNQKQLQSSLPDWTLKYWDKVKGLFTNDVLKQYYASKYGWSEFEDDLEAATDAINTQVGEE